MNNRGVTVVECIIAIAIFSIVSGVGFTLYTQTFSQAAKAEDSAKALLLAEEGLEALRSIRDVNYSALTDGTKGLAISGNTWVQSGTSDMTNRFRRVITIASGPTDTKYATSSVSYSYKGATSTVALGTTLTNWKKSVGSAEYTTINAAGANLSQATSRRLLTGINLVTDGTVATTTITRIQATWTTASRRLQQVRSPNGTTIYTGSVASNALVTLTTPIVIAGAATRGFELYFNSNMNNNNITITFLFSDNSTKSVTINNPPDGV